MSPELKQVSNSFRHGECPCCSSTKIFQVGIISYSQPVSFSNTKVLLTEQPELWKCRDCGSGFTQNTITEKDVLVLYESGSSDSRWKSTPFEESKTDEVIQAIKRVLLGVHTIVDVGCNTGELLDFAKSQGCETIGVELSSSSRTVLIDKGHKALKSLNEIADGSVDVIFAFDLIEHIHDTNSFFSMCFSKLVRSGKIVLLTGDINSRSSKLAKSNWWYVGYCEHIVFPSVHYYKNLAGYDLVRVTPTLASIGYKSCLVKSLISWIIKAPRNSYQGLPALGLDHFLIELEKK